MSERDNEAVAEEGAELTEEEAKKVDVGDVGEEPEDTSDEARDG